MIEEIHDNIDILLLINQMINSGVTLLNSDCINNKTYEDENFVREARYLVNRGDCYRASERLSDASLVSQFTASLHLTGWR